MKVIKKINNNVAICVDRNEHELVAFGKGIGFPQTPYELTDLSRVQRTYYGISSSYLGLLKEIPEHIFELSADIVDYARGIVQNEMNPNIVFTLADHIHFAISRYKKNMKIKMPFSYEIKHLYEIEMQIGERAVRMINEKEHIHLPHEEAISIALHFMNAENMMQNEQGQPDENKIIKDLTEIIEQDFSITINREGFNYSRFVSHLQYLLKRREANTSITSENSKLYHSLKQEFEHTYRCVQHIKEYLNSSLDGIPVMKNCCISCFISIDYVQERIVTVKGITPPQKILKKVFFVLGFLFRQIQWTARVGHWL